MSSSRSLPTPSSGSAARKAESTAARHDPAGPVNHQVVGGRGGAPIDTELPRDRSELWGLDEQTAAGRGCCAKHPVGTRAGIVEEVGQPHHRGVDGGERTQACRLSPEAEQQQGDEQGAHGGS